MNGRVILYGASGYTGRMIAAQLDEVDDLVLAGRDAVKVEAVAASMGREWIAFDLSDPAENAAALAGAKILLNAAGPFDRTAAPLIDACMATGAHYLDLGGEWPVFIDIMARDAEARAANIMLLPGAGLTIAATDCLLLRAKELWPDTVQLDLGISRAQVVSRGSATSMASLVSPTALVCRSGELEEIPSGSLAKAFDFGEGMSEAVAMSWADVVTGSVTTGVPDITVYNEMRWHERVTYRGTGLGMGFAGRNAFRAVGGMMAKRMRQGPSEAKRSPARFSMVVEASDPWRRPRWLRLETLDGYGASARIAEEIVRRVLAGESKPGFVTPAAMFGSSLIETSGAGAFENLSGRSAA